MTIKYPPSIWVNYEKEMAKLKMDNWINFYDAALALYRAKKMEAIATLQLYLYNPTAVSEHSNFLEDVDAWLGVLTDADDKINALEKHLSANTRVEKEK